MLETLLKKLRTRGSIEFHWRQQGEKWVLVPCPDFGNARLTIEEKEPGFWSVLVGGAPLNARYTSLQGAKLDAWQFVTRKAMFMFGTRRLRLVGF